MPACDAFVVCLCANCDALSRVLQEHPHGGRVHGRFLSCTRAFVTDQSRKTRGPAGFADDPAFRGQGSCKSRRRIDPTLK